MVVYSIGEPLSYNGVFGSSIVCELAPEGERKPKLLIKCAIETNRMCAARGVSARAVGRMKKEGRSCSA